MQLIGYNTLKIQFRFLNLSSHPNDTVSHSLHSLHENTVQLAQRLILLDCCCFQSSEVNLPCLHPSQMPFNTGRLPNRCVTGITTFEPFNCISGQRLTNEIFSFSFPAEFFYFNNQLFWNCTALSSLVPLSRLLYAKARTAGCAFL